ncbi:hypothetical protein [Mesorhizobium sp. IMUNJ 23232]|uniref:hypothetical protein n=1 Tax=Mesorhizobium sp. IMUNJ 23232 TaxID=3376064 RepID=UPI0037BC802A
MAHIITGIVASTLTFKALGPIFGEDKPVMLAQGMAFIPLDDQNLDEILGHTSEETIATFQYLTPALNAFLRSASRSGCIAYIETEYHGGQGFQAAAVYDRSAVVLEPEMAEEDVINRALNLLGVRIDKRQHDAFDAIRLGEYRSNQDFRIEASRPAAG